MFHSHVATIDGKPGEFILTRPLVWVDKRRSIEVPRGFITDFASVPGLLQAIPALSPNGLSRRPAVLHDYLYCIGLKDPTTLVTTRKEADDLFYRALLACGVKRAVARVYWLGVRAGGWRYWNKRRTTAFIHEYDFADLPN